MKEFSDFISNITQAHQDEWSRELNVRKHKINLPITDETIDEFMSYIVNTNAELMLKIIREYHEWLQN